MRRLLFVAVLLGAICQVQAQTQPYGNEWIHYNQRYWYFQVWQDGFRRIDSTALADAGFPVGTVDPRTIQLFTRNRQVPIHVEGEQDGVFNGSDFIEFYGFKNDCWMDSTLWDDPAHINNPYYSLYNDTIRYYITIGSQAEALRTIESGSTNWAAYTPLPWAWRTTLLTYPVQYQSGERTQVGVSQCSIGLAEGYFHNQTIASEGDNGTQSYTLGLTDLYAGPNAPPSAYRLVLASLNNSGGTACPDHHLRLEHGGTLLADTVFQGYKLLKFAFDFPPASLGTSSTVVTATSVHDLVCGSLAPDYLDASAPAWQSIRYPGDFVLGDAAVIEVPASADSSLMAYPCEPGHVLYAWAPDGLHRISAVFSSGNTFNAILPPNAQDMKVALARLAGITPVGQMQPVNGTGSFTDPGLNLPDSALVIVTHTSLLAEAQQYATYRQMSPGNHYNTVVADVEQLYDQFGGGIEKHPLAIRNYLRFVYNHAPSKPQALFLIGKSVQCPVTSAFDYGWGYRIVPAAYADCLVPTMGWPNSDVLFGLNIPGNQPGTISVPVGRLAATNGTEVLDYLAKVDSVENQPPAAWMKNILHFRGGNTASEWSQFNAALQSYKVIAEDTSFFGHVTKFMKNGGGVIQQAAADSVSDMIANGVTLMTFFAHAYGGGFDITTDVPTNYQWHGKFPTVIGNSCYTGNIHLYDAHSTSEQFILQHNAGAVAFLSSSDLGLASPLQQYTGDFYRSFSQVNYGKSIGAHIRYASQNQLGGSLEQVNNAETMCLHGDPTLIMNSPKLPDLQVTLADVSAIPAQVSADVDSFQVRVIFRNIGRGTHQPFSVALDRSLPALGFNFPPQFTQVAMQAYQDTVYFTVPTTVGPNGTGLNQLQVRLDMDPDLVPELDNVGNNAVTLNLNITVGDLLPVDPYEFAVVPGSTTMLSASTGDPFAPVRNYIFQIDTTDQFNSPVMEQHSVSAPGGVVQWQPNAIYALNSMQDSVVYYWRCALDSTGQGGYNWHQTSFQHINGRKGWGQAHFFQYKKDELNLMMQDLPQRRFEFQGGTHHIGCEVWGENFWQVYWTKDLAMEEGGGCGNKEALVVGVVDPFDFSTWMSRYNGVGMFFGNVNDTGNCRNRQEKYFIFRENYRAQMDSLGSMLDHKIPDGHYIVVYTFLRLLKDSVAASTAMAALHGLGANNLYNGAVPDSVPYIFYCKVGDPSSAVEVWGDSATAHINFSVAIQAAARSGSIQAPRSNTALDWQGLSWKSLPQQPGDSSRVILSGITPQGNEQPLLDLPGYAGNVDLQPLFTAAQYPQLRLMGRFWNDSLELPLPAQLKRWHLLGTPAPECALDPPAGYLLHLDSVFQGQNAAVMVSVRNISQQPMDSLLMTAWVTDHNNVAHRVHYKYNPPLPVGGTLQDTIRFSTQQFPGPNSILIEANPVDTLTQHYDQPEQYHFNNIAQLRFLTLQDLENPMLDVTFDGIHILDGDIVSAQPEIQITLDDENQTLLLNEPSDTAFFKVFLTDPSGAMKRIYFRENGAEVLQFVPATGPSNVSKVFYRPNLVQDGKYRLTVRATDKSRNNSGDRDNSVNFEVINKPTITEVLNYPNPFTTSTRFVFTLTGREVPTAMRIQIMTIAGRVVREIPMSELGHLHVGRNITDFAWDGTDQFGDRLARGIYLYRVMAQLHGQDIEYRDGGAGSYFTKGFGKMYLLR
ncbi:MAG: hypothetical protein JST38_02300 [Bacteroidetes bacterium]|nr:hypothetical protein [Bacteroidota bacterium]MBS1939694.1 hypothetical protein [Bacteroidota bacterium]